MTEVKNKPGESVTLQTEQVDSNNFRICRVTIEWFGFENQGANELHTGIIDRLNQFAKELSQKKNDG